MNKRQRKKMFTRAFSKAYDESMKWQRKKEQVSITTVKDRRGKVYIITSIASNVEIVNKWTGSLEEINIEGYMLGHKKIGVEK